LIHEKRSSWFLDFVSRHFKKLESFRKRFWELKSFGDFIGTFAQINPKVFS